MVTSNRSLDRSFMKQVVHSRRTANGFVRCVDVEHEVQDNDHQHESMAVIAEERRTKASENDIGTHACGDKEDSSVDVHARQRCDDGTSSKKQLRADENVGDQGKEQEDDMCRLSVADVDDLEVGVASRSVHLGFASQDGEHQDLYCRPGCVPERSGDSIAVAYCGRL